jgi:hypothetical protein
MLPIREDRGYDLKGVEDENEADLFGRGFTCLYPSRTFRSLFRSSAVISSVWCGVVWCGVVWCGVVWCGVVWCRVIVWDQEMYTNKLPLVHMLFPLRVGQSCSHSIHNTSQSITALTKFKKGSIGEYIQTREKNRVTELCSKDTTCLIDTPIARINSWLLTCNKSLHRLGKFYRILLAQISG